LNVDYGYYLMKVWRQQSWEYLGYSFWWSW